MFLAGIAVRRSVSNPDLSQTSMCSRAAVHEKLLLFYSAELENEQDKDIKGAATELEFCFLDCGSRIRPRLVVCKWNWLLLCSHQKYFWLLFASLCHQLCPMASGTLSHPHKGFVSHHPCSCPRDLWVRWGILEFSWGPVAVLGFCGLS